MQTGDSGDECAHSRGNAHGGCQNVIDHQCGGCQQARSGPQIFTGYCIRPAAVRISLNGLPIGEIKDWQQNHDANADGHDISNARDA